MNNQQKRAAQKLAAKIKKNAEEARKTMTENDKQQMDKIPADQIPIQVDHASLYEIWKMGDEAKRSWIAQTRRLETAEKREKELSAENEESRLLIKAQRKELEDQKKQYEIDNENLIKDKADLLEDQNKLLEDLAALKAKELDAENNFFNLHKQFIENLDSELNIFKGQQSDLRKKIAEDVVKWEKDRNAQYRELENYKQSVREEIELERQNAFIRFDNEYSNKLGEYDRQFMEFHDKLEEHIKEILSKIDQKEIDLITRENLLVDEKIKLHKEQINLRLEQEIIEDERTGIEAKIDRKFNLKDENLHAQFEEVNKILNDVRKERDNYYDLLVKREMAIKKFGNRTPEEIDTEIKQLKNTVTGLREELNSRPAESVMEHLKNLRDENEKLSTERVRLLQTEADLRRRSERQEIAVLELETLRDQKSLLETALNDLRSRVQDLTQKKDTKPVFPACADMDKPENGLQDDVDVFEGSINLKEFAEDLRHRIAFDPSTKKILYYSLEDIRAFLGGLAMSKLHLLQGISGTGKTSLPLAFARAVHGGTQIVEVQAGWRDREDLIGHFNAFENRFNENDFLQALYKAQTPAYVNRIFIIVLDEVNLSHPEQYFADILSAMELDEDKRLLTLRPDPVINPPQNFREGRQLHISSNVWFIGTANQDETTTGFAPKTYDRAFILELPDEYKVFPIDKNLPDVLPVSFSSLDNAFLQARSEFGAEAQAVYDFITKKFGKCLSENFRIGWGNRLEKQILSFVPVYIKAGGRRGEAADFIFATKILRKIKDRIENRPKDLNDLDKLINDEWDKFDKESLPLHSSNLIAEELKDLA